MYWLRAHRHWSQAAQVQTLGLPPFPSCVTLGKIPFFFFFFFLLVRAASMAHESSQARGRVTGAASLYHSHSNAGSKPHL